jgi:hypothetical protein
MTLATSLLPVAATAVNGLLQGLSDLKRGGQEFAALLQAQQQPALATDNRRELQEPTLPTNTEVALQVQRDTLRQRFDALQTQLHHSLAECLGSCGIDLSEPVVLTVDADGRWLEDSGHWNRATIEETLAANSALRDQLQQLMDTGQQLHRLSAAGQADSTAQDPRLVVTSQGIHFQAT